jgi:choline-glycine betaine transporter
VIGSAVIVVGVTFIAFLTAIVTSAFIATYEDEERARERKREQASEEETRELLRSVKTQLDAIEARLEAH